MTDKTEYIIDDNRVVHEVKPVDELCDSIKLKYNNLLRKYDKLEKENERLKSEIYKDEEITHFKKLVNNLNKQVNHGFYISDEEFERITAFTKEHDEIHGSAGAIGGRFIFSFLPTSVGVIGTVKCVSCDKTFAFRELE